MTEHSTSPEHFDDCIDCHRAKYATPGMTAEEFAPYLPAHLRQEYWRAKLAEYFTGQDLLAGYVGDNSDPELSHDMAVAAEEIDRTVYGLVEIPALATPSTDTTPGGDR